MKIVDNYEVMGVSFDVVITYRPADPGVGLGEEWFMDECRHGSDDIAGTDLADMILESIINQIEEEKRQ